jgi:hypothetical protein
VSSEGAANNSCLFNIQLLHLDTLADHAAMSRTVTTRFTTFNLPSPNQASLTFSSNPAAIKIIVPKGSQWSMSLHWHVDDAFNCTSVRCLTGHLRVYRENERNNWDFLSGPGGSAAIFKHGEIVSWCSSRKLSDLRTCTEEWGVVFVVPDQNLYRNVSPRAPYQVPIRKL